RGGDRLVAHHADDVRAAVDDLLADGRGLVERTDAALPVFRLQIVLVLLAAHQGDTQLQAFLPRDLLHDALHPVDAGIPAAGATGADDHGNVELRTPLQHDPEIALGPLTREMGFACAEMRRAGIT